MALPALLLLVVVVVVLVLLGVRLDCPSARVMACAEDAVLDLPGWEAPLPSRWFSGFVPAGSRGNGQQQQQQLHHHYVLVESERDPVKDPVLVWTNGGPGASSLFGLFVELGPLLVNADNDLLLRNELSWSKYANLVILNGPVPVGFSYCTPPGPGGSFDSCGSWNDSATAYHNRLAIEGIAKKFPRLLNNDWFFTGESYAGVYIPTLVRELLQFGPKSLRIKGMAIGNGCMGTDVLCFANADYWWRALFLRGHAQVSDRSFLAFERECGDDMRRSIASPKCIDRVRALEKEAGYFYEYDLYSECWYDGDFQPSESPSSLRFMEGPRRVRNSIGGDSFCGGDAALDRLVRNPLFRRAMNIPAGAAFHSGDNGVGFRYDLTEKDLRPFYDSLIANKKMRILVYSGDTDVSVNVFASQNWTSHVKAKVVEAWRPWTLDGGKAVVGYTTRYENDFAFTTIRGSGHMVPQFKAKASFEMLQRFVRNQPLQKYDPSKKKAKDKEEATMGNDQPASIVQVA